MTDRRNETAGAEAMPRAGAGWGWIMAYGVISTVLGLFAFLSPVSATLAATLVVGAFLTVTGGFSLAAGIFAPGHHHRLYAILLGIVSIVVGLITAFEPLTGAFSITLLLAAWLGARGVLEIIWGARHARHRATMIVLGVVNIVLMLIIVGTVPVSVLTLPGYVLGLSLLFGGVAAIMSASAHRKGAPAFALRD